MTRSGNEKDFAIFIATLQYMLYVFFLVYQKGQWGSDWNRRWKAEGEQEDFMKVIDFNK